MLYMCLTLLYIRGMKDIRLISRPIHAPNHELEDTDTNTPPTKSISFLSLSVRTGFGDCLLTGSGWNSFHPDPASNLYDSYLSLCLQY